MAVETVPEIPRKTWLLPADAVTRGDQLIAEVRAIVNLMACAAESDLQPESDSMSMAGLAVNRLLEELKAIVETREG